ncbi:hypothetical protein FRB99_008806 [Tulasnella sp. 403]|nr:hypothetical protein FRB99_008806 [Tulasnella sp. 403]
MDEYTQARRGLAYLLTTLVSIRFVLTYEKSVTEKTLNLGGHASVMWVPDMAGMKMVVEIDKNTIASLDTFAASVPDQCNQNYTGADVPYGRHTITVRNDGPSSQTTTSWSLVIDGFQYTGDPNPPSPKKKSIARPIAEGVVIGLVLLIIIVSVFVCYRRRSRRSTNRARTTIDEEGTGKPDAFAVDEKADVQPGQTPAATLPHSPEGATTSPVAIVASNHGISPGYTRSLSTSLEHAPKHDGVQDLGVNTVVEPTSASRPLPSLPIVASQSSSPPAAVVGTSPTQLTGEQLRLIQSLVERNVPGDRITTVLDSMVSAQTPSSRQAGTEADLPPPPEYDFK